MLGESAEAGDAELGAPGGGGRWSRQRKRPGPLAGRGCWAAKAPREPESLSGFRSSKSQRSWGRRPAASPQAAEPGARWRWARGSWHRDPLGPMQLPPWPCTRRLLQAAPRPRRPCGRMGVLPPPGMLHGASAAFPGRRTADTRPRPEREGGRREEGGREGASTAVSAPAGSAPTRLAGLRPRRRWPLPSRQSLGAPGPLPHLPTRVDPTAKHAHPRT